MANIALIGGTGLTKLSGFEVVDQQQLTTAFGAPSAAITTGTLGSKTIHFLPRHGSNHTIPPHKINYRANIRALHDVGVDTIIAVNAVGGIRQDMPPAKLVIPHQIIDYTWGRSSTFFEENLDHVTHIDFTEPFSEALRQQIFAAAISAEVDLVTDGVYAVTQGPRLETAAEIEWLRRDGADLVGMTAMPEAALARELDMRYAMITVVANWGAGIGTEELTMEIIEGYIQQGMGQLYRLLQELLPRL